VANALPDPQYAKDLSEAMARRKIPLKDGLFVLRVPNTVSKLWDSPDGDTDHGRIMCYEEAAKPALERLQKTVDQLLDLPWTHNRDLMRIEVKRDVLTQGGPDPVSAMPEGTLLRDGTVWYLPEVPFLLRPPHGTENIIRGFMKGLAEKFSKTDLDGGETLPWRRGDDGWEVMQRDVKNAIANGYMDKLTIPHEKSPYRKGVIYVPVRDNKKLAYLPYAAAIEAAVTMNQNGFVKENDKSISALPWFANLSDDISQYRALYLYKDDLAPEHSDIVERMVTLNMLYPHHDGYEIACGALRELMGQQLDEKNRAMVDEIKIMPWSYVQSGLRFCVLKESLSDRQLQIVERLHMEQSDNHFSLRLPSDKQNVQKVLDHAIGAHMNANALVVAVPPSLRTLKWHFDRCFHDTRIRTRAAGLDKEIVADLEAAGLKKCLDNYDVHGPSSSWIGHAYAHAGIYPQLVDIAEANLAADLKTAETFPWQKNAEGEWAVRYSDLRAQQQIVLQRMPHDYWALKGRTQPNYSNDRTYTLKAGLPDRRLHEALEQQRGLVLNKDGPGLAP
jgi:hypothetical protein